MLESVDVVKECGDIDGRRREAEGVVPHVGALGGVIHQVGEVITRTRANELGRRQKSPSRPRMKAKTSSESDSLASAGGATTEVTTAGEDECYLKVDRRRRDNGEEETEC